MKRPHKSSRGKLVDMDALRSKHHDTIAAGNGNMNAKGDTVKKGKVVASTKDKSKAYYKQPLVVPKKVSLKDTSENLRKKPTTARSTSSSPKTDLVKEANKQIAEKHILLKDTNKPKEPTKKVEVETIETIPEPTIPGMSPIEEFLKGEQKKVLELDPADRDWEYEGNGEKIYKPEAGFNSKTVWPEANKPVETKTDVKQVKTKKTKASKKNTKSSRTKKEIELENGDIKIVYIDNEGKEHDSKE